MATDILSGSFWFLFAYDVGEEIDLEALRKLVPPNVGPTFRRAAPDYVKFERPPVVERLAPVTVEGVGELRGELNYYDYGVVSVKLELPFAHSWPDLVARWSRLIDSPEAQAHANEVVRLRLARVSACLKKPHEAWLDEEYAVVHVDAASSPLIQEHGPEIAQIVRGEATPLSVGERDEVLRSQLSYFPHDLIVVGWTAAFIYDTAQGAAAAIQLLEYANSQLLQFRHYDRVLTEVLEGVHRSLARQTGLWARWRMANEARQLNSILLEVRQLTERADTAIKFLSDMYSARVYRLAAEKIGVGDYRRLVDSKLHTAAELYTFMMDQFHSSRAFVLELMVVIILVIDLVYLFKGKAKG